MYLTMQVMSYGASAEAAATTAIFTRMLQHSLKDSNGLSQHPAATGTALPKCYMEVHVHPCRNTCNHTEEATCIASVTLGYKH